MAVLVYETLPAYRAAQRAESRNREREFTGRSHSICGIKIRSMSMQDHLILDEIKSPFIHTRIPTRAELCFFLWLLSPAMERWNQELGWRKQCLVGCRWRWFSIEYWESVLHGRRCRRFLKLDQVKINENSPLAIATKACFEYVDAMFRDCPAPANAQSHESYFSYLANWCDVIRSEYQCPEHEVMAMPLTKLWQYIRAITRRHNPDASWPSAECQKIKKATRAALKSGALTFGDFSAGRVKWDGEKWILSDPAKIANN